MNRSGIKLSEQGRQEYDNYKPNIVNNHPDFQNQIGEDPLSIRKAKPQGRDLPHLTGPDSVFRAQQERPANLLSTSFKEISPEQNLIESSNSRLLARLRLMKEVKHATPTRKFSSASASKFQMIEQSPQQSSPQQLMDVGFKSLTITSENQERDQDLIPSFN